MITIKCASPDCPCKRPKRDVGGTPQTLAGAIANGLRDASVPEDALLKKDADLIAYVVQDHVLDFLRQRFGVAYLQLDPANGSGIGKDECFLILDELSKSIGVK